jgi:hypothetical protein
VDISDPQTGQDLSFKRVGIQFSAFQLLQSQAIPEPWYKDLPTFTELLYFTDEAEILRHLATQGEVKAPDEVSPAVEKKTETVMPSRTRSTRNTCTPPAAVETVREDVPVEIPTPTTPATTPSAVPVTEQVPPAENKSVSNQVAAKLAEFQKRRAAATKGK